MPVMNASSGKTAYGVREFYLDNVAELIQVKDRYCRPGSCAYIIETGEVYILSNAGNWVLQGEAGTSDPSAANYIWDGGDIVP